MMACALACIGGRALEQDREAGQTTGNFADYQNHRNIKQPMSNRDFGSSSSYKASLSLSLEYTCVYRYMYVS